MSPIRTSPRELATMKREALLASPFFAHLRSAELDELIAHSQERRLSRGTLIFSKGDPGSSMLAVLSGLIRVGATSADGREITLNVIGPGEIVGEIALLDGRPRSADAVAAEETLVMAIERRYFLPFLVRHEGLVERMLGVLCDRLRKTSAALEELALLDLPARMARTLVKLADDYGKPTPQGGMRIEIKLSQKDMSNLVAATRESVNKQFKVWREAAMIEMDGGHVVITDMAALKSLIGD
jgi:CRP/FNR family transcriptional regulator, cyclic AMP receptor protein